MNDLNSQLEYIFALGQSLLLTWGLRLLGALAVIIVGRMVAGSVRKAVGRLMERSETDATLRKFLSSLVYYLVLVVAGVAALSMIGIQMASVLTILATAGLAVGLALQGALSNPPFPALQSGRCHRCRRGTHGKGGIHWPFLHHHEHPGQRSHRRSELRHLRWNHS